MIRVVSQQASRYWPNTVGSTGLVLFCTPYLYWPGTGPILGRYWASTDLFVLAQYCTNSTYTVLAQYRTITGSILEQFFSICPVQARYWVSTNLFVWAQTPSIGPIHHIPYWASTGPVPIQYCDSFPVLAQCRSSTWVK